MKLPPNTPIFELPSEKLGNIKVRRLNVETYEKIFDAFPDIDSAVPEEVVKFIFAQVCYWPDSLNEKGEFQDKGTVGEKNAERLNEDELESFAEQILDKDNNLPYCRFIIASKKQDDKPENDELEKKENESNVEYLYRIIAIKAKENKVATEKMLKAAIPFSIDEIFPKSALDSVRDSLTASEQLMSQVKKMQSWYDPADFKVPKSALDILNDTIAQDADHYKGLAETTGALNESRRVNHEPQLIRDLPLKPLKIPPNPIEGTNERLDTLLDHQKEAVQLTATSASLLTKMNKAFLELIGDLRVGGRSTLAVAGLTLIVTLCSLVYAVYATKQSNASSVVMVESMKTLNDRTVQFFGQQNAILEELLTQNVNEATSHEILNQLIEINKDMRKFVEEPNTKPSLQKQVPPKKQIEKSKP